MFQLITMTDSMKRHSELLKTLSKASPAIRKSILKSADKGLIQSICSFVLNILKGRVHLKPSHKSKLRRHKKFLRKIARKGDCWKTKKKFLVQSGGAFLPLLIAPLISGLLGSIFNSG